MTCQHSTHAPHAPAARGCPKIFLAIGKTPNRRPRLPDRGGKGLGLVEDEEPVLLGPVPMKMAAGRGGGGDRL
ncbi:unnamed protein product, partial [Prunus brigantina]